MAVRYGKNSDWILRLDLRREGESAPHWVPVLGGFQTLGESRSDTTSEFYYLDGFGGAERSVDGTARVFATTGHRVYGDELQDWLFAYERQWDTAARSVAAQYFNAVTGEGEQGTVSLSFSSTQGGAPQERAAFGVTIAFQGRPAQYRHGRGPFRVRYHSEAGASEDERAYAIGESAVVQLPGDEEDESFAGWNTRADGTGGVYQPGNLLCMLDDVTLYAVYGAQ